MKAHYIRFEAEATDEQIAEALNKLQVSSDRRTLAVAMPDNTYQIIGEIVKFDDCPQDVFDKAMELMGKLAYGVL